MSADCTQFSSVAAWRHWRWQAWAAVSVAGFFSLPPVILRGPMFENMLPTQRIFDVSLIIHVNASVLFWLLATMFAMLTDRMRDAPAADPRG